MRFKTWFAYRTGINLYKDRFLGKHTRLGKNVFINKNVSVGDYTDMNSGRIGEETTIGKYCSISSGVEIGMGQHPLDWLTMNDLIKKFYPKYKELNSKYLGSNVREKTIIGNDVWIGHNASIMAGVKIGNGAVIGAGAIVTKNIPAYAIYAGIPAKLIRYRFDAATINKLEELKWWDYPESVIAELPFNDVKRCIEILVEKKHMISNKTLNISEKSKE